MEERDDEKNRGALNDECDIRRHARHRTRGRERVAMARRAVSDRSEFANSCVIVRVKIVSSPDVGAAGTCRTNQYRRASLISAFPFMGMVAAVAVPRAAAVAARAIVAAF